MKVDLGTAAAIVTSVATLCVLLYVSTGPLFAVIVLLCSALAMAAWVRRPADAEAGPAVVVPYVGVIVLELLLNAVRYWSGYPGHMAAAWPTLFVPHYVSADQIWFFATVSVPLSLMLAGGYALLRGHAIGRYAAWWTFAYVMADAVLQLAVEFATPGYEHRFYLGALLAAGVIATAVLGWMRMAGRSRPGPVRSYTPLTRRQKIVWSIGFFAFAITYGATLYSQAGYMPVVIIVGSMFGGLFAWLRTTAVTPVDRLKVVPLYLLMLALFYIHVGEEGLTGFAHAIALISGNPWSEGDFLEIIGLLGPVLWVAAAIGMWLRQPWGDFLVWFMTVGMILGEPMHHVMFPTLAAINLGVGYTYFSGMITALFPMIPAIVLAAAIVTEARKVSSKKPISQRSAETTPVAAI